MAIISFLGAGSTVFAKNLLGDTMLTPETRDVFTSRSGVFPAVEFLRDKQGKVSGFKLPDAGVTFEKTGGVETGKDTASQNKK